MAESKTESGAPRQRFSSRFAPFGWLFGLLFFWELFAAAFLSVLGAFEVLVAGLVDNTRLERRAAVLILTRVSGGS